MNIRTILVAGGAGFIGTHLCRWLLQGGNRVICLDNFVTGSRDNTLEFIDNPLYSVVEWDVCDPLPMPFGEFKIDWIFNLASPASPAVYFTMPVETLMTNVVGTRNLLELARYEGSRLLLASTSEVYGDPLVHPQREDYLGNVNCLGVRGCYDEGKRAAECLVRDYRRKYGVDGRIVRIFNTYGDGMAIDDGRVVSNFIVASISGRPLKVNGGGQTRSFCYVGDTVLGLQRVMTGDIIEPVNIGNPVEITVRELAEKIIALGSRGSIDIVGSMMGDPQRRCPDITRAISLGWSPSVDLERGLRLTYQYFLGKLGGKQA